MSRIRIRITAALLAFLQWLIIGGGLSALSMLMPFIINTNKARVHAAIFAGMTVSVVIGLIRGVVVFVQTAHMPGDFLERGAHSGDLERGGKEPSDDSPSGAK